MFLRTATSGLLLAVGGLAAWAGTQALETETGGVQLAPVEASSEAPPEPARGADPTPAERSPQVASPEGATGSATVDGAWSPEVQVTHGSSRAVGAVGHTLAVLPDGTRVIVWRGGQRGGPAVISRSSDGLRWSEPQVVPGTQFAMSPNVAASSDGTLHLLFGQRKGPQQSLWHLASKDGGASWGGATQISRATSAPQAGQSIAVDDKGRVHVAWHLGDPVAGTTQSTIWYTRSAPGGRGFSTPQQLGAGLAGHGAFPRLVLTGASGDVVAVPFRGQQDPPDWDVLVAVSRDGGATFTTSAAVDTRFRDWDPEAWVDADDVIHLAWMTQRGGGLGVTIDYSRSADFGANWTAPVSLNTVSSRFPSWAPTADGQSAWLLWKDERDFGTAPCVGRERCADLAGAFTQDGGQSWSTPELFTDLGQVEVKFPSISVDAAGSVHLMWSDKRDPVEQIFYAVRQAP
jgi:hypothetical protein